MIIDQRTKIHVCCADEANREVLNHPWITKILSQYYLVASNGRIAAFVPVTLNDSPTEEKEKEQLGAVSIDTIKDALAGCKNGVVQITLTKDYEEFKDKKGRRVRNDRLTFNHPDVACYIPSTEIEPLDPMDIKILQEQRPEKWKPGCIPGFTLGFNAEYLMKLQQGLMCEGIEMHLAFTGSVDPIKVTPLAKSVEPNALGVIMPITKARL